MRASSNRALIISKDGDVATSLDSHSVLDHHRGENIFSGWVSEVALSIASCPLAVPLQEQSGSILSVPSEDKAADRCKALSFIISILNKPGLLSLSQLGYIGCFCKRCRWSRALLAFQLLSCFLRWKEAFTGKESICERLLGLPLLVPHYKSQQLSFADISYLVLFHL